MFAAHYIHLFFSQWTSQLFSFWSYCEKWYYEHYHNIFVKIVWDDLVHRKQNSQGK